MDSAAGRVMVSCRRAVGEEWSLGPLGTLSFRQGVGSKAVHKLRRDEAMQRP